MQSYIIWSRNQGMIYEPARHIYSCMASTLSLIPSIVQNLNVVSFCFNYNGLITFDLMWSPPTTFNGESSNYNVCIGSEPLEFDALPNQGHFCDMDSLQVYC